MIVYFTLSNQGPADPMSADDPARVFSKLTDDDRKAMVVKAYEQLKITFEKYTKPSGDKNAPARTCRDLAVAHPELTSGKHESNVSNQFHMTLIGPPLQVITGSTPTRATLRIPSWSSATWNAEPRASVPNQTKQNRSLIKANHVPKFGSPKWMLASR